MLVFSLHFPLSLEILNCSLKAVLLDKFHPMKHCLPVVLPVRSPKTSLGFCWKFGHQEKIASSLLTGTLLTCFGERLFHRGRQESAGSQWSNIVSIGERLVVFNIRNSKYHYGTHRRVLLESNAIADASNLPNIHDDFPYHCVDDSKVLW